MPGFLPSAYTLARQRFSRSFREMESRIAEHAHNPLARPGAMSAPGHVPVKEIRCAAARLAGRIRPTPLQSSRSLTRVLGVPVYLKLENLQTTGSFKFRGATNAMLQLSAAQKAAGVVGVSTGNHGRGLARAASNAGVRCVIAMSSLVPENKVHAIREEGAEVVISGHSQDEAQAEVDARMAGGMTMLPPFDHPHIIAGQGTIGLELAEDLPEVETVLVQLSGGGLMSGIAAAMKAHNPDVRIIGVSMERGAAMHASLAAGHPVEIEELATLADSLGGGIGLENKHTFSMVRDLVDEVILLSEAEIAEGIRHCYWQERQIVEGSGAVCVAAILAGKVSSRVPVAALLSGANIDMALHHRIVSGENVDVSNKDEPCPTSSF